MLYFSGLLSSFEVFLPFEYTRWVGIYFDVIWSLLLLSMQNNFTLSRLFKRYYSMILKLQVFEVIRIALQNIKTDGSRFLRLRNENNNNKTSDLFPTSAMQSLPQNTSL